VPLEAEELVGLFVQRGMFDEAQASAAGANVDLSGFFTVLSDRCVRLTQPDNDRDIDAPSSSWLYKSSVTAHLQGPPSALAMRYLQNALERHDSAQTNFKYREIVADELFSLNKDMHSGWKMPGWLVEWEMERDPAGWISRALRWGWVKEAVEWSLDLLRKVSCRRSKVGRSTADIQQQTPPELLPKKADASDTPWNLLDRVVAAAKDGVEKDEKSVQVGVAALQDEMRRLAEGLQKIKLSR
jgi:nuclear pore complex protein Nup160